MKIEGGRLVGEQIEHLSSPNHSGMFDAGGPDTLILHYTACGSAASAVSILSDPLRKVSAHLVVGRDGKITQLLPFDTIGWHAGRSSWETRSELNQFSLGIEIDNAGRLEQREGRLSTWFEREIDRADAVAGVHRHEDVSSWWHSYPQGQLAVVEDLCRLLTSTYPIRYILGHEEVSPQRKVDPGPAFPLDELRQRLLSEPDSPIAQGGAVDAERRDSTS